MVNQQGQRVEVPRHSDIKRGTARSIAQQAAIDWHEFEQAISSAFTTSDDDDEELEEPPSPQRAAS